MKILTVADVESPYIWDFFNAKAFNDVDLILSCGDLKANYLSFLVTMLNVPLFYIHGNHDDHYAENPPLGCLCVDDQLMVYKGLRILGLGGSYRYSNGIFQYSEKEMVKRYKSLRRKITKHNGFDILLTHAPSAGLYDTNDLPHTGFNLFNQLIDIYKPSYFLHGHVHLNYSWKHPRQQTKDLTTVINGYNYHQFDYQSNGFQYQTPSWLDRFKGHNAY